MKLNKIRQCLIYALPEFFDTNGHVKDGGRDNVEEAIFQYVPINGGERALRKCTGRQLYWAIFAQYLAKCDYRNQPIKWYETLEINPEDENIDWEQMYKGYSSKLEADVAWRYMHGKVADLVFLRRSNRVLSDNCNVCQSRGNIQHVFFECRKLGQLHEKVKTIAEQIMPNNPYCLRRFTFGYDDSDKDDYRPKLLNYIVTLAKTCINSVNFRALHDENNAVQEEYLREFQIKLKGKILVEFNYYKLCNNLRGFEKKWLCGQILASYDQRRGLHFNI